jgi:hypothetical protein
MKFVPSKINFLNLLVKTSYYYLVDANGGVHRSKKRSFNRPAVLLRHFILMFEIIYAPPPHFGAFQT